MATTPEELRTAVASAPTRGNRRVLQGQELNAAVKAAIYGEDPRNLRIAPTPSVPQALAGDRAGALVTSA